MVSSRTADRPHGPYRVYAPLSSAETDDGKGRGEGERAVLHGHVPEEPPPAPRRQALSTFLSTSKMCLPPGRGQTGCPLCLVRRNGFCGAPWSRSSTACRLSLSPPHLRAADGGLSGGSAEDPGPLSSWREGREGHQGALALYAPCPSALLAS